MTPDEQLTMEVGRTARRANDVVAAIRDLWTKSGGASSDHVPPSRTADLIDACRRLVPLVFADDLQPVVLDALREAQLAYKRRGTVVHERWIPARGSELTWVAGEVLYKRSIRNEWSLDQLRDVSDSLTRCQMRLIAAATIAYEDSHPNLREHAPRRPLLALLRGEFKVTAAGGAQLTRSAFED